MSDTDPRVSVIVPTYGRPRYLRQALDSLLSQTFKSNEIIVVDGRQSARASTLLKGYGERVRYLPSEMQGKSAAVNHGLSYARGEYVWILDDDDVAISTALSRYVEALDDNAQHGFAYGTFYKALSNPDGSLGRIVRESTAPDYADTDFLLRLLKSNFLGGSTLFVRRSVFETVGHYNERLMRSQDYDIAIRIARRFSGVRVRGGSTYYYRQHEGTRGPSLDEFAAHSREAKWLEYNQVIFRRLYRELPLRLYLGRTTDDRGIAVQRALLQRMAVMASKGLSDESVSDLQLLAQSDTSAISLQEKQIACELANCMAKNAQQLKPLVTEFVRLKNSPVVAPLRKLILKSLLTRECLHRPRRALKVATSLLGSTS